MVAGEQGAAAGNKAVVNFQPYLLELSPVYETSDGDRELLLNCIKPAYGEPYNQQSI